MQPSNRHGDPRSITVGDIKQATKTAAHREGSVGTSMSSIASMMVKTAKAGKRKRK